MGGPLVAAPAQDIAGRSHQEHRHTRSQTDQRVAGHPGALARNVACAGSARPGATEVPRAAAGAVHRHVHHPQCDRADCGARKTAQRPAAPHLATFEVCRNHPAITYHGFQPNHVVRAALQDAHIFAYPSIFMETSCIAAIEALSAGCYVVCPRYGALPETTAGFALSYDWHEELAVHAERFASALAAAIKGYRRPEVQHCLRVQKEATDLGYAWQARGAEWQALFETLTQAGPARREPL